MGMSENDDRWYFTKERLGETPSRRHGYDTDKELSCRQQAANFIQDMGQKLQVSQLCINTAIVYMHRFYVFHSLQQFHRNAIATAALFLAAKVEEQPRKVEHVLKVAHLCLHRETPTSLDTKSELYIEQSNDLVINESILLQTLGFDVAIDHPHTHVVRCCQLVKASKDLAQTSYFMASNSLHLTTMCLQYKPTVVACFCIHLACKWSNWEIPRSSEGKDWFWYVNQSVTLDLLEQLTSEFLLIFDKCPTKLKRKMMSINQTNPPVNLTQPAVSQESYHFDEPRKLMGAEANRPPESFLQMQKSSDLGLASCGPTTTQRPNQQQAAAANVPPRYIDYKEYKEKRERERQERERVERARDNSHPTHHSKTNDKPKQQSSQRNITPQKVYPAPRTHSGSASKESSHAHSQKVPSKEAIKRKFDDMEGAPPETQNHAERHKNVNPVPEVKPNPAPAQPFNREKTHRDDRAYPNYPYQRSGDKHGATARATAPPKVQEAPKNEEPVAHPDWHGKPADRYHAKTAPPVQTVQPKTKEAKPKAVVAAQSLPHPKKTGEKAKKYHEPSGSDRSLPASMDSLLMFDDPNTKPKPEVKRPYPLEAQKKEKTAPGAKYQPKPKQGAPVNFPTQVYKEPVQFEPPSELELPQLIDKVERPAKMPRLEERKKYEPEPIKPLMSLLEDQLVKPGKSTSIFSPESNVSPQNIISSLDKEIRKPEISNQYPTSHQKKMISSLFSPPSVTSRTNDREIIFPAQNVNTMPDNSLPLLDDTRGTADHRKPKIPSLLSVQPTMIINPQPAINRPIRHNAEPGAIIYPPQEKPKMPSAFPAPIIEKPISSPVSTVNLLGMEKMLDTSISPSTAAVIKPMTSIRPEPVHPKPLIIPPMKIEEKPHYEGEYHKKSEKKKNKDKDKERHKDKKKSDGKKEKKKHKDKDKERKKESLKHWDKSQNSHPPDSHLKLTIPKERLHTGESSGLKIKIAKDRLKPEEPINEGGLKIKIKKDVIANYKDEKSKRKEYSSTSHHKSHRSESGTVLKVMKTDKGHKSAIPE